MTWVSQMLCMNQTKFICFNSLVKFISFCEFFFLFLFFNFKLLLRSKDSSLFRCEFLPQILMAKMTTKPKRRYLGYSVIFYLFKSPGYIVSNQHFVEDPYSFLSFEIIILACGSPYPCVGYSDMHITVSDREFFLNPNLILFPNICSQNFC